MTTDSKSARSFPTGPNEPDEIARLLKEAGPRPHVDTDRAERVRTAVHAQWLDTTRARARRRFALRSLAAVAAVASVVLGLRLITRDNVPNPATPTNPVMTVGVLEIVTGSLNAREAVAARGDTVFTGSHLETDANARAALRLSSGPSLRLDVSTRVLVDSPSAFTIESGAVYVDSGANDVPLAIRTPLGVARDIGTQFEVRLRDSEVVIRVREGRVELSRDDGVHEAFAGDEIRLTRDGELELGSVLPYAPQWEWTTRASPPFTLEGSSLAAFLAWVSREQGWTTRFEDPALEESASTILLEGPVLNVAPAATLATVLPACGLTYRIENGQLWVVDAR